MSVILRAQTLVKPSHSWLRTVSLAFAPGPTTPLLEVFAAELLDCFRQRGHIVQEGPGDDTDLILTSAPFAEPLAWRQALLFSARRRFRLSRSPTILTLMHVRPNELNAALDRLQHALAKEPPDPGDFAYPGLVPQAPHVLIEQGRRGGPILALQRLLQAQAKCVRLLLVVGEDRPQAAYHFDLVGAYPRSDAAEPFLPRNGIRRAVPGGAAADLEDFYDDIVLRVVTTLSTAEVTRHEVVGEPIPRTTWGQRTTPAAMARAGRELDQRGFFTEMVRIADLVAVPALDEAIASQYSEGCFATWDPELQALIATVTGSARPVDKRRIGDHDLAVIVGVRPDGLGALVRHVQGRPNDPPSSEAVEMIDMDAPLPRVAVPWAADGMQAPVIRSKLHGHRGVASYDPARVEYAPLDPPYFHYLVSCATEAQARGIKAAFARSQALRDPHDPRAIVFSILPGHGVVIVEKWVAAKEPFQAIWEAMDAGHLQVENRVPQGPLSYQAGPDGRMVLSVED
ncbi:MAG TPA: hypothetical protein VJ123_10975 [Anaerolineales bacterium]|nr:hypothetical protein [Anaerolineales bacterium]